MGAEKPADEVAKPKESEMKEESSEFPNSRGEADEDRDGTERGNLPRGEPSRRGRGGGALRKGRGGSGGRGASSRGRGRDSYSRDGRDTRDDRRPPPSRDGTQRYDSGFRNDSDLRDSYREPRGRGREDEMRQNARDGPPGRGAYRRPRPDRPPRFQKNSHGRGRVRPQRSDQRSDMASSRTKETNDRSQINSGNNSDGASKGASRPPLPRQNSSDLNNDEWETASESSNFNDHKAREKEVASEGQKTSADNKAVKDSGSAPRSNGNPESRPRNDRRDVGRKAPTTNQRQGADRPGNSHRDSYRSDYDRRDKGYRNGRDNRGPSSRGGRGRGGERKSDNGPFVKRGAGQQRGSSEQNHSDVYRMDTIIYDDQRSVNNALNACMHPKKATMPMGKPLDSTTPVSLPVSREKTKIITDKRIDVLSNGIQSVVVVDDVPEVIVENPDELLTPDAGFQPVLSRKQKAAEYERKKMETLSSEVRHISPRLFKGNPPKGVFHKD
eukprot:XP_011665130.1 PREDICTED: protein PRRC2C-like [Strongylocentrotus purpuratus]